MATPASRVEVHRPRQAVSASDRVALARAAVKVERATDVKTTVIAPSSAAKRAAPAVKVERAMTASERVADARLRASRASTTAPKVRARSPAPAPATSTRATSPARAHPSSRQRSLSPTDRAHADARARSRSPTDRAPASGPRSRSHSPKNQAVQRLLAAPQPIVHVHRSAPNAARVARASRMQRQPRVTVVTSRASLPAAAKRPTSVASAPAVTKRALLVGCNYNATPSLQLYGCVNDAVNMRTMLINYFGFPTANVRLMTDDAGVTPDSMMRPTAANLVRELTALTTGLVAGDLAVFHFSGHGLRYVDSSRDEADGRDEAILSSAARALVDDAQRPIVDTAARAGVRLRLFFDSCHSGTVVDLPYVLSATGAPVRDGATALAAASANVLMISGSRDTQYSMDTYLENQPQGAMSCLLQTVLETAARASAGAYKWTDVLAALRAALKNGGYSQVPQLTFSQPALATALLDL
jgi:hypothetical protein